MQRIILGLFLVMAGAGCTATEKAAAIGGLGGATLGGIIGHQSGHDLTGAAIGGAAGAVGGMVVGENMIQKKFCPSCGREFGSDQKFCPYDGTELKAKQK